MDGAVTRPSSGLGPGLRDPSTVAAVQEALPEVVVALAAVLTWLGDPALLLAVVAVHRWLGDRDEGLAVLGAALAATALVVGAKAFFGLPRPPGAVATVAADGYGFPSGHAVGATVVWGALALAVDHGSRRARLAAAGVVAAVVAATRVAIGVHYPVDVAVGVAVGVALLGGYRLIAWGDRRRMAAVAVALAVAAVLASGGSRDAFLILGAALAFAAERRLPGTTADRERWTVPPALAVLGMLWMGARLAPVAVAPAAGALLGWWVLSAPGAIGGLRRAATARI